MERFTCGEVQLKHSLGYTLEKRPFSLGSEQEPNPRSLTHNPNLLPSPPLPFPPVDEFKRFGFKIPIFPLTAGNYSNDSRSAGCAVYTLFTSRSSVVGCVSSVIKFREKAFKKISFFLSSIVLPLWHGCSQQFPRAG